MVIFPEHGPPTVRKVPSDRAVVGELAEGTLTFGTTVATNGLLERTGVPTLLLVTAGFEDLVRIGDMSRPDLFDPDARRPTALCERVAGLPGRVDVRGREIEPLELPVDLDLGGIQSVAVVLLHGAAFPGHERRVVAWLRDRHPDLHVVCGAEVDQDVGYLARIETTLVDASLTPLLRRAMQRDRIPEGALAMRSDGSLCPAQQLRAPEAVLSGPAGGVLAVAAVAAQAGFQRAVGLDMGGTSTDVCRVDRGDLPRRDGVVEVAGVRLRKPMLEVATIAAGGGSVLRSDGLRLQVGPQSAGAAPGPQCYGRGGPPTLTDAALALGLIDALAFDPPLRPDRVDLPGPAQDFVDVAREAMANAVRRLAAARGVDLTDHALVSYGGAAGQHAADVAARLGIATVLVHPCAAVLSAWGQHLARREEEARRALWSPLHDAWHDLPTCIDQLTQSLPDLGEARVTLELRPRGTDHALDVPWGGDLHEVEQAFVAAHRQRYGFDRRTLDLELVAVRVRSLAPPPPTPPLQADPFDLGGQAVRGPAVLTSPTTSVQVPTGWVARHTQGLLRLDLEHAPPPAASTERTPLGVALWGQRFMSVAEQAGETLRRLARSVNIRERLDFSCAVFDEQGHLVANAPHIPVHLGAMGETVRDLIRSVDPLPHGQAWLTNDPAAGGSHLPDLTVVSAVHHQGRRFFVACRGHHVDVGGSTPGSMPPHARSLAEEGVVLWRLPLLLDGALRPDLDEHLAGCRDVATVMADLEAQIASNHAAATLLRDLGSADLLAVWMAHLQDVAAEAVQQHLHHLTLGHAQDDLGGTPLRVAVTRDGDRLQIDWTGTGAARADNLNAPAAVVRAAVLYALRVLVRTDIPLNEGALRCVDLVVPAASRLAPPAGAAVSGGNVETSQRLVDLLLQAMGFSGSGPGSMSNLTLGGHGWTFYETLGGGSGASARGPGASARQVHMTNTRATDVEVLEHRLPLRVRRFQVRAGTGGAGRNTGGDGLIREVELCAPGSAALLAAWRPDGAPGLDGGAPGASGEAWVYQHGAWRSWSGEGLALQAGDRVRVSTPGGGGWGLPPGPSA